MTQAQQPEALRLAAICETKGMFPVADELNRMHARILELEQGKCLHQITEPAARFCPECGHVGDVGAGHRDCCPDGSSAFTVPAKWANELRAGFKAQLAAAPRAVQAAVPSDGEIDAVIQAFDWQGWTYPEKAKRAFTREVLARWAAPAQPAEGAPNGQ